MGIVARLSLSQLKNQSGRTREALVTNSEKNPFVKKLLINLHKVFNSLLLLVFGWCCFFVFIGSIQTHIC